jgi:Ca2+-binding EF-hand superfamily protein
MLTRKNRVRIIVVIAVLVATATMLGTAAAQKTGVPKAQDRLAMGEDGVRELLMLMETDGKGMVSKQEYLKFLEAEFDRLDRNKKGELNARELTQSNLSANRSAGK